MSGEPDAQLKLPEFLIKDYELKINYFTSHLTRMWTRFQIFVTLETALVAVLIVQGSLSSVATQIAIVQAVISAIWYLMGRHDCRLVSIYRAHVTTAADALREFGLPEGYRDVIDVRPVESHGNWIFEATRANEVPYLAAALPALLFIGWLVVILLTLIA